MKRKTSGVPTLACPSLDAAAVMYSNPTALSMKAECSAEEKGACLWMQAFLVSMVIVCTSTSLCPKCFPSSTSPRPHNSLHSRTPGLPILSHPAALQGSRPLPRPAQTPCACVLEPDRGVAGREAHTVSTLSEVWGPTLSIGL